MSRISLHRTQATALTPVMSGNMASPDGASRVIVSMSDSSYCNKPFTLSNFPLTITLVGIHVTVDSISAAFRLEGKVGC